MAESIDLTPVLGNKAQIYRRAVGGSFYVVLWLSSEKKRLRRSLNTPDLSVALQKAEDLFSTVCNVSEPVRKVMAFSLGDLLLSKCRNRCGGKH